jgi:hypothetical protein
MYRWKKEKLRNALGTKRFGTLALQVDSFVKGFSVSDHKDIQTTPRFEVGPEDLELF